MKVICLSLILALSPLINLAAQELSLRSPVQYDIDLHALHLAAVQGDDSGIPRNRLLIIDGYIGDRNIIEDEDDYFLAEIELVGGHWEGEEHVELYRASILFEGTEYRELFVSRGDVRFKNGEKLIVVAAYLGLDEDYTSDELVPVLKSLFWRRAR